MNIIRGRTVGPAATRFAQRPGKGPLERRLRRGRRLGCGQPIRGALLEDGRSDERGGQRGDHKEQSQEKVTHSRTAVFRVEASLRNSRGEVAW